MDILIFTRDLEFLGIVDNFFSLRWVRKYSKCGEFELHCSLTEEVIKLLVKDNIICKKDSFEAAYIETRNIKLDQEGKEILIVKGKFLSAYLDRRIIWLKENLNCTVEVAIRTLINNNCIDSADKNRIIKNLKLGEFKDFTEKLNYQVSYKNLLDEVESLSETNKLGFYTNIDVQNKKYVFNIYKGLNRSINQTINPKAIFSKEFENILEQEFFDSFNNYKNTVLIAGAGEDKDRKLTAIEEGTDLDRFELFIDARDIQDTKTVGNGENQHEEQIPVEEYNKLLINRGLSKLSETKEIQTFDSKINVTSNLKYKKDFDLGDIVTCINKKWKLILNTRITEIEEVYDSNSLNINITFGDNIPTLIDKIKQVVR